MRNIFFLFAATFFLACSPQKSTSSSGSVSEGTIVKKQGIKMYGKIIVKSVSNGTTEKAQLYFDRNGVEYFINIPVGKVSESELKKYIYKEIDVLGEIKTGKYFKGDTRTRSTQESIPNQEGQYLVIYKVLE